MASIGVNTNASQFYLTFGPAPHLDGRCTVVGRLVEGESVLNSIEQVCFGILKKSHAFCQYSLFVLYLFCILGFHS